MVSTYNLSSMEAMMGRISAMYKRHNELPHFGRDGDDIMRRRALLVRGLHEQADSLAELIGGEIGENNEEQRLTHTNDILEYFGFSDGEERAGLLRSVSGTGDYSYAADNVKMAYIVARKYGLEDNPIDTPQATKDIFVALVRSTHLNGPKIHC